MIVLLFVVAILIFMVSKLKCHAVIALLTASIILALLVGTPISDIPDLLNKGFGDTCKSVALIIFLGSLLGLILSEPAQFKNSQIRLLSSAAPKAFFGPSASAASSSASRFSPIPSACLLFRCAPTFLRKPVSP